MKYRVLNLLMEWLGPLLLRLWFSTIRLRWCGGALANPDPRTRSGVIYVLWHQRVGTFAYTHARMGARILVSRSRDGEMVTRMLVRMGFTMVRGSSQRGGGEAVRALLAEAHSGYDIGIMVDGPRGPRYVFKVGAVYLASRSGLPIVPIVVSYHRHWSLKSWDRFQIPRPFTWGVVRTGEPVTVPPDLDEAGLEAWRLRLEGTLADHTRDTDDRLAALYREGRRRREL
jgi:lysophospholipid acyltransferase (LPLAT)-like uncharacterized protein